jgi:predicted ferric reductase
VGEVSMRKLIFFFLYFLSPLVPILVLYRSNPGWYGGDGRFSMILGSIAYSWLLAQLMISARPKVLASVFGLDRVYRFHMVMPFVAMVIGFIHKIMKEQIFDESVKTQFGNAALLLFVVTSILAFVFLADILVRFVKPVRYAVAWLKKTVVGKYNIQKTLHNITVVAVVLIFVHVLLTYSAKNVWVKAVYILYFAISVCFYLYHKVIRWVLLSRRFVVERVTSESDNMFTLILTPENGKVFHYLPGQFGYIRVKDNGISGEEHPFSFSSEPSNHDNISMTIKNLGDWTSQVGHIREGSRVRVDAPYGRFCPSLYPGEEGIVLIAGGVGISPMLGILRDFYLHKKDQKVLLVWGVNTHIELIYQEEIAVWKRDMRNLAFVPVIAQEKNYDGETGFITREILEKAIRSQGYDMMRISFYVCGPAAMQVSLLNILRSMSIHRKHIHDENFSY